MANHRVKNPSHKINKSGVEEQLNSLEKPRFQGDKKVLCIQQNIRSSACHPSGADILLPMERLECGLVIYYGRFTLLHREYSCCCNATLEELRVAKDILRSFTQSCCDRYFDVNIRSRDCLYVNRLDDSEPTDLSLDSAVPLPPTPGSFMASFNFLFRFSSPQLLVLVHSHNSHQFCFHPPQADVSTIKP